MLARYNVKPNRDFPSDSSWRNQEMARFLHAAVTPSGYGGYHNDLTSRSMDEIRRSGFWQYRLFGQMFGSFGALAVVLAIVGVYGVLSYSVSQRTQEFGVRMALGAEPRDVRRMMIWQGLRLAAWGTAFGAVGALGITRVIGSLLYNVTPTDPVSFGGVMVLMLGVAAAAAYLPARRATLVDPMVALRAE
jgi:ABC-type antimicrobial peptide transport system permease subunit